VSAPHPVRQPFAPSLGGAFRDALSDFFYNSLRLLGANLAWGVVFLAFIFLAFAWLPGAIVALVVLIIPTAGLFRLAALIARDRPASFSDAVTGWREFSIPALEVGVAVVGATVVLGANMIVGLWTGQLIGWVIATLAFWGLVAVWAVAIVLWPLLADPERVNDPLATRVRLAATIVLAWPVRVALLACAIGIVLVASTIMLAALLTISVAFVALVASRFVIPLADRIEHRRVSDQATEQTTER